MARSHGVQDGDASLTTRAVFRAARRKVGQVPAPLRIMALNPAVMWAAGGFELGLERAKALDPRVKDLAAIKAATLVGCVF